MKTTSTRGAKNALGLMIDTAHAGAFLIEKHGRGVVVVVAVEEHEHLIGKPTADQRTAPSGTKLMLILARPRASAAFAC